MKVLLVGEQNMYSQGVVELLDGEIFCTCLFFFFHLSVIGLRYLKNFARDDRSIELADCSEKIDFVMIR